MNSIKKRMYNAIPVFRLIQFMTISQGLIIRSTKNKADKVLYILLTSESVSKLGALAETWTKSLYEAKVTKEVIFIVGSSMSDPILLITKPQK